MDLNLADFVLFVLLGSGALIVFFTFISRTTRKRAECRALGRRVICRLCLHAFQTAPAEKIVSCPRCGAMNEKGETRQSG